jgi:hypothetical protein
MLLKHKVSIQVDQVALAINQETLLVSRFTLLVSVFSITALVRNLVALRVGGKFTNKPVLREFGKVEKLGEFATFECILGEKYLSSTVANVSFSGDQVATLVDEATCRIFLQIRHSAIQFGEAAHHLVDSECLSGVAVQSGELPIIQLRNVENNLTIGLDQTALFIVEETLEVDRSILSVNHALIVFLMSKCARVSGVIVRGMVASKFERIKVKSLDTEGGREVFVELSKQNLATSAGDHIAGGVK